jgi:catechol 2,3-dioxygenase-like lactoylglutathione lyase family enzyme
MIRVRKIDHVAIRVSDVAASAEFYTGLLGLAPAPLPAATSPDFRQRMQAASGAPAPTGGMWVEVPGSQIHMIKAERTEGIANPFGPHIAFEVEDFEEAKRTLDEHGLTYTEAPDGMPFRQLWLLDPNGNTIELWVRKN